MDMESIIDKLKEKKVEKRYTEDDLISFAWYVYKFLHDLPEGKPRHIEIKEWEKQK